MDVAHCPLPVLCLSFLFFIHFIGLQKENKFGGFLAGRWHWKDSSVRWEGRAVTGWEGEKEREESNLTEKAGKFGVGKSRLDVGFG